MQIRPPGAPRWAALIAAAICILKSNAAGLALALALPPQLRRDWTSSLRVCTYSIRFSRRQLLFTTPRGGEPREAARTGTRRTKKHQPPAAAVCSAALPPPRHCFPGTFQDKRTAEGNSVARVRGVLKGGRRAGGRSPGKGVSGRGGGASRGGRARARRFSAPREEGGTRSPSR